MTQNVQEFPPQKYKDDFLKNFFGDTVFMTKIESVINWGRKYSLWPMPFGTACCAIEFMGTVSAAFDISRFGAEVVRFSPRQSDLLLVMGTINYKQAPVLKKIYEQKLTCEH